MGDGRRRHRWILFAALVAVLGAVVAWRLALVPSPEPGADSGGAGGDAPEALAGEGAPLSEGKPARLEASGKSRSAPVGTALPAASVADPAAASAVDLRGLVVDEAGKPVARAEVRGRDRAEGEALLEGAVLPVITVTGADGRFVVPAGPGRTGRSVNLSAPGLSQRGTEAYLEAGAETRIVMVASCPLRVHVTEEGSDRPVPDALVHAITGPMVAGVWGSSLDAPAAEVVRTDLAGRATLPTEGGPAILIVRPGSHVPVVVSGLSVPRGGTDVEVRVVRGGVLVVSVRGPAGGPLIGARVQLDVRPAFRRSGLTESDGRARFEGLPSTVRVQDLEEDVGPLLLVTVPGLETHAAAFALPDSDATLSLEVRLRPARWLRGTVRRVDGTAAAGVRVRAELRTGGSALERACAPPEAISGPDGSFALGPVMEGLWAVHALRANGVPVAGTDVPVSPEGELPPVAIVLPSTTGRLSVRVVDASERGVAVVRLEVRATRGMYRLTVAEGVTDAAGAARLLELAPESARLILRPPGSAPVSRELTADDYDGRELRIALGSGRIGGRVVGTDRRPRRVHVKIHAEIDGCIEASTPVQSDEAGAFVFTGLSPGTHRVSVNDADGVLVGGDAMVSTGTADTTLMVATPVEAARLHVELGLVDATTGGPVPVPGFRAQVVLVGRSDRKEWREPHGPDDGDGRFLSFETLPPGIYDGQLIVPGYEEVDLGAITLPMDGEPRTVRLTRKPEGAK